VHVEGVNNWYSMCICCIWFNEKAPEDYVAHWYRYVHLNNVSGYILLIWC